LAFVIVALELVALRLRTLLLRANSVQWRHAMVAEGRIELPTLGL
jgi:hypothetical protein